METIRPRVSVLVTNCDQFVLIFRHKNNQDYYAIPGGGIELGETPQQAATREIQEELGFKIRNLKKVSEIKTGSRDDHNFIAKTNDKEIIVTGPEKNGLNNPNNLFKPEWHTKESFRRDLPIFPETAREMFNNFINQ